MRLGGISWGRSVRLGILLCAFALVLVPSASASHSFSDVPDGHIFHNEIAIFKNTNITSGCTATTYCPDDFLRRQGMAAFITRALGLVVRPNESTLKGVPGSRVAMLDDDLTFVGTQDGALELSYNGVRGLRLEDAAGLPNVIGGAGGNSVTAGVFGATIGGGGAVDTGNRVTDHWGTVAGGLENTASHFATVAGGVSNTASGSVATVLGGQENTASGNFAIVAGGLTNTASGDVSFAAGNRARADDQGAFVWADTQAADIVSPGVNTFSVRAAGGVWLGTTSTPSIPAGVFLNTSTGGHLTTGGTWTNASDRAAKERFSAVDGERLLHALAAIPIQSWSYKKEPGVRHLGPVAQDFYRAFRLGGSDKHIATVDAEGVALAAIQALHRQNLALERENRQQEARLAKLERAVAKLTQQGNRR